jgi:ATP-dependent Lon protease
LAYTEVGGKALLIESTKFPGTGALNLTGQLGDVMKESVNTSLSWIKSNASRIGILNHPNKQKLRIEMADDPSTAQKE